MEFFKWVLIIVIVVIVLAFGLGFIDQTIEKNTWGEFRYKVTVDDVWYATNEYNIDDKGCIHFIDNYGQNWQWCEKFSVGEYYFHKNRPSLKTIWFGY